MIVVKLIGNDFSVEIVRNGKNVVIGQVQTEKVYSKSELITLSKNSLLEFLLEKPTIIVKIPAEPMEWVIGSYAQVDEHDIFDSLWTNQELHISLERIQLIQIEQFELNAEHFILQYLIG